MRIPGTATLGRWGLSREEGGGREKRGQLGCMFLRLLMRGGGRC